MMTMTMGSVISGGKALGSVCSLCNRMTQENLYRGLFLWCSFVPFQVDRKRLLDIVTFSFCVQWMRNNMSEMRIRCQDSQL